jgi:OOP family OmpA-OmpF porin
LQGGAGRALIVFVSDGRLQTGQRAESAQSVLQLASDLVAARTGELCIHTVQVGDSAAGGELLRSLSRVSACGSYRREAEFRNATVLQAYARDVFIASTGALPAVGAGPPDDDRDGVANSADRCPGTPFGAPVDARGCWARPRPNFAFDSAALSAADRHGLDELAEVLRRDSGLSASLTGYTDTKGSEAYNLGLSERRARAVGDYLASQGVAASRLEAAGSGIANPLGSNDSEEGRAENRRVEIELSR